MIASHNRRAPGVCSRQERNSGTRARILNPRPLCIKSCHTRPLNIIRIGSARASEAVASVDVAEKYSTSRGAPVPLGPSPTSTGMNFALFSAHASNVKLCLFDSANQPMGEYSMHKSGDVWHVEVSNCPRANMLYGVRVYGDGGWDVGHRWDPSCVLLDPYAPLVSGRRVFGVRDNVEQYKPEIGSVFRGSFDFESPEFDWEGVSSPGHHLKDLIIYEVPLRTFTAAESSGLPEGQRGTFLGLAAKADHLTDLGINAVELLPVFEYDELEFQRGPNPRDHMVNVWGYSHISFMAPMSRFATDGSGPVAAAAEFKQMVKTLHSKGIEVILDVVYNHTAEGSDVNPYVLSYRCIDCMTYYQMNLKQYEQLLNYSGCGNTINANNPTTAQLIIDSLRFWVEEYHVDGFRFDLATCLCRDSDGTLLEVPPLIRAIAKDSVLNKTKLIAEPWDIGGYQVGSFPNWDVWAEWNGMYRDVVRRFIRGDLGMKKDLATRISGSADLYHNHNRKPYHSINFVNAHDGFSLMDLVSYNEKHNDANGEQGRDGTSDNFSWNCGNEGPTADHAIQALRWRQMRNFHLALMMSQGTPMIVSGDEYGHTHHGNNNWYGHDNELSWFSWKNGTKEQEFYRFYSSLIKFRRSCPLLGRGSFLSDDDITWHEAHWDNEASKFIAFTLHGRKFAHGDLYCAFNSHRGTVHVTLPPAPSGQKWCRLVDTNLPSPRDWVEGGNKGVEQEYCITGKSSILLLSKPVDGIHS